jgi:DNA polymerase-3 subunit epsilon
MTSLAGKFRGLFGARSVVDPGLPLGQIPFVVVDTELTGLDFKRDSVVSIGAVKMSGTRIELGQALYRLVSPQSRFNRESIVVHGITPDDVFEKPHFDSVVGELLAFCGDRVLVGHFLSIDLGFLSRESAAVRDAGWRWRAVDTMRIHVWVEQHRYRHGDGMAVPEGDLNLFAIAQKSGIPIRGAHNALTDAYITAQLLQRQLRTLPALGVRTLGDLLRIGRP